MSSPIRHSILFRKERPITNILTHTKIHIYINKARGEGKVHPRTGHEGPEGEWRYSSTLSLT